MVLTSEVMDPAGGEGGDGAGAGRAVGEFGVGGGELEEALAPDEVDPEGRPQRVSPPTGAVDLAVPLADQGVVHHGDEGRVGGQPPGHLAGGDGEEAAAVHPLLFEDAVGRAPVDLGAAATVRSGPRFF